MPTIEVLELAVVAESVGVELGVGVGVGLEVDVEVGVGVAAVASAATVASVAADAVGIPTDSAPQPLSNRAARLIANELFDVRTLNSTLRNSVKLKWQKLPKAKLHNSVNGMWFGQKRDQLRQNYGGLRIQFGFSVIQPKMEKDNTV
ncbi:MAG: hypothetical protein ABGW87_00615 [Sphingomonadaceae bacterium]